MTETPSYPVLDADMTLIFAGLSLKVNSVKEIVELVKQNAAAQNKALLVRVDVGPEATGLKVAPDGSFTVLPRAPKRTDALVTAVDWTLSAGGAYLASRPSYAAIKADAEAIARQLDVDHFIVRGLDITNVAVERDDSSESVPVVQPPATVESPAPAEATSDDADATMLASQMAYGSSPLTVMGAWTSPSQDSTATTVVYGTATASEPDEAPQAPAPEPNVEAVVDSADSTLAVSDSDPEPALGEDLQVGENAEDDVQPPSGASLAVLSRWRTPLVLGVCGVLVVGAAVGATTTIKALATPAHSPATTQTAPTTAESVVAGYAGTPAASFRSDTYRMTRNGLHVAYLDSSGTMTVVNADGSKVTDGKRTTDTKAVFKDAKKDDIRGIYPWGQDGFSALVGTGKNARVVTWSPETGFVKGDRLPSGTTLALRSGHVWTSSPSTAAGTKITLLEGKPVVYPSPTNSGASLLGFGDNSAIWAALTSKKQPQVRTTNASGKVTHETALTKPAKDATIARWLTANSKFTLILWKTGKSYELVLHQADNGKIHAKTAFSVPTGQDLTNVSLDSDPATGLHGFGAHLIDLPKGTFPAPKPLAGGDIRALRPRAGGVLKVMTNGDTSFYRTDGWKNITATHGDVVDLTPQAVVVSDGNTINLYPSR